MQQLCCIPCWWSRCAHLLCKRNLHLEDSTLVPVMLSLPSVSRSHTGCPNVKNLSHILVICSSVMNRKIRKLWAEFETSYRNCILWYFVKKKKIHCLHGIHMLIVDDANSPDTLSSIMSVGSQWGELGCIRYILEHSPWYHNTSLVSQQIPDILWTLKFHQHFPKSPPLVPSQSQIHPLHTLSPT